MKDEWFREHLRHEPEKCNKCARLFLSYGGSLEGLGWDPEGYAVGWVDDDYQPERASVADRLEKLVVRAIGPAPICTKPVPCGCGLIHWNKCK